MSIDYKAKFNRLVVEMSEILDHQHRSAFIAFAKSVADATFEETVDEPNYKEMSFVLNEKHNKGNLEERSFTFKVLSEDDAAIVLRPVNCFHSNSTFEEPSRNTIAFSKTRINICFLTKDASPQSTVYRQLTLDYRGNGTYLWGLM